MPFCVEALLVTFFLANKHSPTSSRSWIPELAALKYNRDKYRIGLDFDFRLDFLVGTQKVLYYTPPSPTHCQAQ